MTKPELRYAMDDNGQWHDVTLFTRNAELEAELERIRNYIYEGKDGYAFKELEAENQRLRDELAKTKE